jgi:hypothetical protein
VADPSPPTSNTTERVLEAAARVLAPLIRLFIAKGVTYQMADELMKRVYVQVAQTKFVEDEEATGTRLSLLTGLNRKEIRRLTSDERGDRRAPMSSYASAVNAMWRTQRKWRDKDGQPKVLPRRSDSSAPSFDDLVKSVTTDHRPSAVFEELMRLDYISIDESDQVRLKQGAFSATPDTADKLLRMAENLEDHLSAAVTNVIESEPRFLEQFVYSDELSSASAEELHQLARQEWRKLDEIFIDKAISLETRDALAKQQRKNRIRIGVYFFSEETPNVENSTDK